MKATRDDGHPERPLSIRAPGPAGLVPVAPRRHRRDRRDAPTRLRPRRLVRHRARVLPRGPGDLLPRDGAGLVRHGHHPLPGPPSSVHRPRRRPRQFRNGNHDALVLDQPNGEARVARHRAVRGGMRQEHA